MLQETARADVDIYKGTKGFVSSPMNMYAGLQ